jgi:hypothetical protein
MNNDVEFGIGIGVGIVSTLTLALMFLFGFVVGEGVGIVKGEEKTALITVQAFNKIKQQLPKDTKINNPFTSQQLDSLSNSAQKILNLF